MKNANVKAGNNAPMDVQSYPIANIVVEHADNGRAFADETNVEYLMEGYKRGDQIPPVGLSVEENGKRKVRVGFGRVKAAKLAGRKEIDFYEVKETDPAKLLEANIRENVRRKQLTPVDMMLDCQRLKDAGKTMQQIADIIGKSHATVVQLLKLAKLPKDVLKSIHDDEMAFDAAIELLKTAEKTKKDPAELARAAAEVAAEDAADVEKGDKPEGAARKERVAKSAKTNKVKATAKHVKAASEGKKSAKNTTDGYLMSPKDIRAAIIAFNRDGEPQSMRRFSDAFIAMCHKQQLLGERKVVDATRLLQVARACFRSDAEYKRAEASAKGE